MIAFYILAISICSSHTLSVDLSMHTLSQLQRALKLLVLSRDTIGLNVRVSISYLRNFHSTLSPICHQRTRVADV